MSCHLSPTPADTLRPTRLVAQARPPQGLLQRACACGRHTGAGGECEACRKQREQGLQRASITATTTSVVPPVVHDVLRAPGRSLDAATRGALGARLGADFSHVRVHTDAQAAASARAVNALAYTVGRDVVFGAGQYAPTTPQGQRLLAHELTHVIQQGTASPDTTSLAVGPTDDAFEREAASVAEGVGGVQAATDHRGGVLQREPDPQAPSPEQAREAQLRALATRPSLALRQWSRLSQADRDQVLWTMISTYGAPFTTEFQKYARGDKKPNIGPPGALKGFNYTPRYLFDRGYRHAYGELWVHPSGEEVMLLAPGKPGAEKPPDDEPVDMAKKCPETCFDNSDDEDGCRECCAETFSDVTSECRRYCEARCDNKL